jgi:hypothetical protein
MAKRRCCHKAHHRLFRLRAVRCKHDVIGSKGDGECVRAEVATHRELLQTHGTQGVFHPRLHHRQMRERHDGEKKTHRRAVAALTHVS